ncbi:unnamed protein product, partial [Callosobruchus maculatus]
MVAHILGLIKFSVIAGRQKIDDIKRRLQTTEFSYESNGNHLTLSVSIFEKIQH